MGFKEARLGMYANGIETRERILKKGKQLFLEKGYRATTYRDICDAAQVNPGTLAHHFGGKSGLAKELYQATIDQLMQIVRQRFPQEDDLMQVLVTTIAYFRLLFDDEAFRHFFAEYVVDSQETATAMGLDNGVTEKMFSDVLGEESARIVMPLDFGMDRAFEGLILERANTMDQESSIRLYFLMTYAPIPDADDLITRAWDLARSFEISFKDFELEPTLLVG